MNRTANERLIGAVEAGGTKFVCAVGTGPGGGLREVVRFPTGDDPAVVFARMNGWFHEMQDRHGALEALGVASFGPLDLDRASPTYGFITTTPKPGWHHADLVGSLRRAFPDLPVGFDTDVNGAALGEWRWGAATGLDDFVYLTVGTGVGGGGMVGGKPLHGLVHPEMGHMGLPALPGDEFEGACPFHGRCWEGLCAGPAIARRTGMAAEDLPADHPAWEIVIRYMAHALVNLTCVLSPRRIILGGSIRKAGQLGEERFFTRLRGAFREAMNGYLRHPALDEVGIRSFLVPPALGDEAGVCGAIALGQQAAAEHRA